MIYLTLRRANMDGYEVRPIGWIESTLTDVADAPRQGDEGAPDAWVVVRPELAAALHGVEPGADIVVVTWLHLARRDVLVTRPRDDPARPLTGIFATRSADRPNPVGLHRVRVLAVAGVRLRVGGCEAVDGTPVLDLKPVLGPAPAR
jgi:tRNA-Thr(GGU) m(6)t(6)A37 methyltransferase TsaA